MSGRGLLITFEGSDGCGKSTHVARLAEHMRALGLEVLVLREPGSTRIGESIRRILLDPENSEMSPWCELLLYEASRAQLVEEALSPALERGEVVICDRFSDSTMAYQGFARGLGEEAVRAADSIATRGISPDRTIFLERPVATSLGAATSEDKDRLEREPMEFHGSVHDAFERIAADDPERVRRVEVGDDPDTTFALILEQLSDLLAPAASGGEAAADDE